MIAAVSLALSSDEDATWKTVGLLGIFLIAFAVHCACSVPFRVSF